MAATDSPDTTTGTHEAERPAATTGGRFERPGEVAAAPAGKSAGGSTAAIVLGAVGIVGGLFIPIIGLVLGIIGLVLGMQARKAGGGSAGAIVSAIAIVVSVANWIATVLIMTS
jgi:hypothetical protein